MLAVFQDVFFCLGKSKFVKLTERNVMLLISRVFLITVLLSHSHSEGGMGGKGQNLIKSSSDFIL